MPCTWTGSYFNLILSWTKILQQRDTVLALRMDSIKESLASMSSGWRKFAERFRFRSSCMELPAYRMKPFGRALQTVFARSITRRTCVSHFLAASSSICQIHRMHMTRKNIMRRDARKSKNMSWTAFSFAAVMARRKHQFTKTRLLSILFIPTPAHLSIWVRWKRNQHRSNVYCNETENLIRTTNTTIVTQPFDLMWVDAPLDKQ